MTRKLPSDELKRTDPEMFQAIYDSTENDITVIDFREEASGGDYTFWVHYDGYDIQIYRSRGTYFIADPVNSEVENGNKRDVVQLILTVA
jgi:hypothetical protein